MMITETITQETAHVIREAQRLLLGDEAIAQAAVDAGILAAYGYPGTPSTEIMEYLQKESREGLEFLAEWAANEKTAYEQALGVSMMGFRSLVVMKHVGLNVAADPFMNSAIVSIRGGLVVAVADDPSMYSSQNEQDSRYLADFARIMCLEPSDQQETYDMTREAFEISERFHIPVLVRLVTRLAHSRSSVIREPGIPIQSLGRDRNHGAWTLLPANSRKQWRQLLDFQEEMKSYSHESVHNKLTISNENHGLGIITAGTARNYYLENQSDLSFQPDWLHIGAYPLPTVMIRNIARRVRRLLVIENGYPYIERFVRGILPTPIRIEGRMSGAIPEDGELTPEIVASALGIKQRVFQTWEGVPTPGRPPQLCSGCPHSDTFRAVKKALEEMPEPVITGDIGCYTLGALSPYDALETCVCMGASIGMAKGAANTGSYPVIAFIGDSTFCHSGITPLLDAASHNADMTVIILDNEAVAMTGAQDSCVPSDRLSDLVLGTGVDPAHLHRVEAHPGKIEVLAAIIRRELEYHGLSAVISHRACPEKLKQRKKRGGLSQ